MQNNDICFHIMELFIDNIVCNMKDILKRITFKNDIFDYIKTEDDYENIKKYLQKNKIDMEKIYKQLCTEVFNDSKDIYRLRLMNCLRNIIRFL